MTSPNHVCLAHHDLKKVDKVCETWDFVFVIKPDL